MVFSNRLLKLPVRSSDSLPADAAIGDMVWCEEDDGPWVFAAEGWNPARPYGWQGRSSC